MTCFSISAFLFRNSSAFAVDLPKRSGKGLEAAFSVVFRFKFLPWLEGPALPTGLRGEGRRGGGDPSALLGGDVADGFLTGVLAAAAAPPVEDDSAGGGGGGLDAAPCSKCRGTLDGVGLECLGFPPTDGDLCLLALRSAASCCFAACSRRLCSFALLFW